MALFEFLEKSFKNIPVRPRKIPIYYRRKYKLKFEAVLFIYIFPEL